jgi:uncharacterized protein YceK
MKQSFVLFIGLLLLTSGCASVHPPTAEEAYYSHTAAHTYPEPNPCDSDWWWCLASFWPLSR